jgi:hypothetical protein
MTWRATPARPAVTGRPSSRTPGTRGRPTTRARGRHAKTRFAMRGRRSVAGPKPAVGTAPRVGGRRGGALRGHGDARERRRPGASRAVGPGTVAEKRRRGDARQTPQWSTSSASRRELPRRAFPLAHPPAGASHARFKSPGQAQRCLAAYGPIAPSFHPRRHRLSASADRHEMGWPNGEPRA